MNWTQDLFPEVAVAARNLGRAQEIATLLDAGGRVRRGVRGGRSSGARALHPAQGVGEDDREALRRERPAAEIVPGAA